MVFNATLNNISVISWQLVLLVEETGVRGEKHRPATSHWQTLSHNVVSSTSRLSEVRTHKVSGHRHRMHRWLWIPLPYDHDHNNLSNKVMPHEQYLLSSIEFIFILEIRSISTLYIYIEYSVLLIRYPSSNSKLEWLEGQTLSNYRYLWTKVGIR